MGLHNEDNSFLKSKDRVHETTKTIRSFFHYTIYRPLQN